MFGREKLGSTAAEDTAATLWTTLQSHYVMFESSEYEIKIHHYITPIFVRFLITENISGTIKEVCQTKKDIKGFSKNSY